METLTAWAIRKVRSALTLLACLVLYGIYSYNLLPKNEDPGFVVKSAQVLTLFPGASAERVELLVTDKLEKVIQEIPEIDSVESESTNGTSVITIHLRQQYRNVRPIWDTLRRKVEKAKLELPSEAVGPFVNDEFGDTFGTLLVIKGDGFSHSELEHIADEVKNELLLIDQVAKVDLFGVKKQAIFVEMENAKIAEMGGSSLQLQQILKKANIVLSGGELQTEQERLFLEPTGNFSGVEAIEDVVLYNPKEQDVFSLKDVSTVVRGYQDPPREEVYEREEPAVVLAISMQQDGNIQKMGEDIRALIEELNQKYPLGVDLGLFLAQDTIVKENVDNFVTNILESCFIVILIMLVVFGVRTGLIAASLIPLTIVISFVFMNIFSIWIDQISLACLVISLGLLVDSSIVMTESILFKWQNKQMSLYDAAISSTKELWIPLLTSSLTTSIAFLPTFLAGSNVGEYTGALFKVVTITLFCSWVLSFTWIPLLCFYSLKSKVIEKKSNGSMQHVYAFYRKFLIFICHYKLVGVFLFIFLFCSGVVVFHYVPSSFFPPKEQNLIALEIEMPSSSHFASTRKVVEKTSDFIEHNLSYQEEKGIEGVANWLSFVGGLYPRYTLNVSPQTPGPDRALILLKTSDHAANAKVVKEIKAFFANTFPDVRLVAREMTYGVYVESPIAYNLLVKETDDIYLLRDQVKEELKQIPGVKNVRDNWGERVKKIVVDVDPVRAQRAGVTNFDVAVSLQTALTGFKATELRQEDKLIPIVLRSVEEERESLEKLKHLSIFSQTGKESVPLSQIAQIRLEWGPSIIHRKNRLKAVRVLAEVDTEQVGVPFVDQKMGDYFDAQQAFWPLGSFWEYSGQKYESVQAEASVYKEMPAALLLILIVMMLQFDSFRLTLIILSTIPLSLIGVAWGLFLAGSTYGFMSFLGVISLAGIIVNNGIVLLEEVKINIEKKKLSSPVAILLACQLRLRPIFLTTLTTIGGLSPLLLAGGGMFQQMSLAIISGLLFGGALTLGFVPLLYVLLYRVSFEGVREDEAVL